MRLRSKRLSRTFLPALVPAMVAALLAAPLMLNRRASSQPGADATAQTSRQQALETYGRIPLSFEVNRGQTESSVNFLAHGAGYALFLRPAEAVFVLRKTEPQSKVLRMRLVGADESAAASGEGELAGRVNYLIGDDPSRWRTDVQTCARVRYASVYPGVDLVYYGNQRQLEYDFRVAPGADAQAVSLRFEGADQVELDASGDLLLTLGGSVVRQPKPLVYQEVAGVRRAVEGGYRLGADGRVRFALGEYDRSAPLVIDPSIVYSTYLGGSSNELPQAIAVDSAGSAYLTGFTISTDFPSANALQSTNAGVTDVFVTKLNPAGTALVYSTYLGGSSIEQGWDIAVDSAGNAYLTGNTRSDDFPKVNAIQSVLNNTQDVFVAKLNATGAALIYSTYLGGGQTFESGQGIAADSAGNAYVAGYTTSADFPVTAGAFQGTIRGSTDAFVTKVNAAGTALVYSTYLGGANSFDQGLGVAVDCTGNAYVTGLTASTDFPVTAGAFQTTSGGGLTDAFVTKLNTSGTALVYSTYLGGGGGDSGEAIAIDAAGNAYVTGLAESINFPTANPIQPSNNAAAGVLQDAFVTKLNAAGAALVYSTYLGGGSGDVGRGIGVDQAGNAYVSGATGSANFPLVNAIQGTQSGGSDAFVTKVNAGGTAFVYSTYLGGSAASGEEQSLGIAVDSAGNAYVVGRTDSTDFPTVNPIQATKAGAAGPPPPLDAFVTKIADVNTAATSQFQFAQTALAVQEDVTSVTMTVQRTGDTTQAATVDYATSDGTASERRDYTTAVGTLRFAAGETSKTFDLLVNEDSFAEGPETFNVALSNPTGGATLSCLTAVATVQITDDAAEPAANVIDDPTIFVGQHYHDFLNRQADAAGLSFWANQIIACGANAACVDNRRTNVSQAFFLSIEFQSTGYYVFRTYKASFTDSAARPRGMPRYREFLRDAQEIGRGVVVRVGDWQQQLEANKQEFARRWVQRPDFVAQFPLSMNRDEYVNKLAANLGVAPLSPSEFIVATESYTQTIEGRATTLRNVVELNSVYNAQFNPGFVLSQYIGYLRRNPNDAPEPGLDYAGFDFWLAKMNSFSLPGEDVRDPETAQRRAQRAEMVRAFILSAEYRGRFGQP